MAGTQLQETIKFWEDLIKYADVMQKQTTGAEDVTWTAPNGETGKSFLGYVKELFANYGHLPRFKTAEALKKNDTDFVNGVENSIELKDGSYAFVADDVNTKNGIYVKENGTWRKSKYNLNEVLKTEVYTKSGKNKANKNEFVAGQYVSPSAGKIAPSSAYRRSGFIPVEAGQTYTLSGVNEQMDVIGWFSDTKSDSMISFVRAVTATAPEGAKYAVFNITNEGESETKYDDTAQFEEGQKTTEYEAFIEKIDLDKIYNLKNLLNSKLAHHEILERKTKNLINPDDIDFIRRYSTGSKRFVNDSLPIAATDYIPVEEGEWYVLSGSAKYGKLPGSGQGGYFSAHGEDNALENVSFVAPVDNNGHAFKVPAGRGITHVVLSLVKTTDNELDGVAQLEKGEQATAYQPYELKPLIKTELLPANQTVSNASGTFNDAAWYTYTKADAGKIYQDKLPRFRKAMLLKNEDVVVVNTGTSLTARTSEHSTLRDDAAFRPPMMHSNAFCSLIWDALAWEGQQYRRYDSGYFTESGSFNTSSNLSEWDDGAYRDGLTRYSESNNAQVSFKIPSDAWQFNFIYRTDSKGCTAKITIVEGDGKVQVFDESSNNWVEANDYTFSQLEATPVARTVQIPSTVTTNTVSKELASKGNTMYQKRLKMRVRNDDGTFSNLGTVKNVIIKRVGGSRFMYWGVEWSPRQYMITYINAARGSHNTSATGERGLPRFQDNEIWQFKPTLILSELGIHNDGAAAAASYPVGHWAGLAHNYVTNTDFELSMFSRAAHFNNTDVEYAFFTASITWNFGGIDEDGNLKLEMQSKSLKGNPKMMTALDKYQEATEFLNSNGVVCIDAAKRWVDAGFAIFGDLKTATEGSGKDGVTFTNEGSHWNDTGSKIVAKTVISLL